jgi:hypothetical protein
MEKVHTANLVQEMRRALPELEATYQEEVRSWNEEHVPTSYDFVGFVFKPYFKQELAQQGVTDFIRRAAEFFERVCETGDPEAVNVIWVKIFEWLLPRPDETKLLWPSLGSNTRAAIQDAASRWGYSLAFLDEKAPPIS